jgi:hypothetical protein
MEPVRDADLACVVRDRLVDTTGPPGRISVGFADGAGLIAEPVGGAVSASLEGARVLDVAWGHGSARTCPRDCSRNAHRT